MIIIKCTIQRRLDEVPIFLNADRIISIKEGYDGMSLIDFGGDDVVEVTESPQEIVGLINQERI